MVLFNKKRVLFLVYCFLFSMLCISLKNIKPEENVDSIQTSSTPVSSHTIILDAGHGKPDRTEL